jgi:hypothetical protein
MGIVVTVFMLLALLLLSPWPAQLVAWRRAGPAACRTLAFGVLSAGLWNALWHGLRHLGDFWGIAALVSGLLMVAAAVLSLRSGAADSPHPSAGAPARSKSLTPVLMAALSACFLLYAVTLVRLNLGYAIIGG